MSTVKKKHSSIIIALVAGGIGFIILVVVGVVLVTSHNVNKQTNEARQLADKYYVVTQNYSTLPSSVTKTQSQWDSYYGGLISQLKNIQQTNLQDTYTTTSLNTFKQDFGTAISDSINYLTATQSATDTSFTITADNNTITQDNNTIQEYQADDVTDGEALMAGYITTEQTDVTNEQTTLKNDQQTETQENNQASQIQQTLNTDYKTLGQASRAAGFQIN